MYQKNRESLAKSLNGVSEDSLDYKIKTRIANEKLEFWCETELAKCFDLQNLKAKNIKDEASLKRLIPSIQFLEDKDFEERFANYQETYLAAHLNKEIMSQLTDL